jgi:hypothetical protein
MRALIDMIIQRYRPLQLPGFLRGLLILGLLLAPCRLAIAAEEPAASIPDTSTPDTSTPDASTPKTKTVPAGEAPSETSPEPGSADTPDTTDDKAGAAPAKPPTTPLKPGLLWHYSESAQSALLDAEPGGWPKPQRIWLETPSTTATATDGTPPERFLALWQAPTERALRGKLLIAPCEKAVVSRPLQLTRLQSDLAASGFSSLVVTLPGQNTKVLPPRPAPVQAAPASPADGTDKGADEVDADVTPAEALPDEKDQVFDDSADPVQTETVAPAAATDATPTDEALAPPRDNRQQARDRLLSALAHITEQGRAPLFGLGCGLGAEQLLNALATEPNSLSGWILVNPLLGEPQNLATASWWPNMKGPVLDILTAPAQQSATAYKRDQQKARKIAASGKAASPYLTREMAPDSLDTRTETATESALARAIRGFLLRYTVAP